MTYFKRNSIFWGFSLVYLVVVSLAFIPAEDSEITETTLHTLEINSEAFGAQCDCEYLVYGANGLNTFVVTRGATPIFNASSLGNHSGSFTVSTPYTYTVSWESLNAATASISVECCNLGCHNGSVTIPAGGGSGQAFTYSAAGGSSGCSQPTCW